MPKEEVKGLKNKMAMKAISKISKTATKDNDIKWNFTKFLVDKNGNVVKDMIQLVILYLLKTILKNYYNKGEYYECY